MEDGAPVHHGYIAKEYDAMHGLEKLEWPAQFLDLNPIKNVWKVLKDAIQKRLHPPKNRDEMRATLRDEWEKLDITFCHALVARMSSRSA